jgi:DNA-binding NtrC family response regulator
MCDVLGMQLSRAGYTVECISDAASAFIKLSIEAFDLVLTDLMMPGMSGTDLLRMIRKAENDIPVIVLTGRESLDAAITAAGLQVSDYLKKGATSGRDLLDAVERVLGDRADV